MQHGSFSPLVFTPYDGASRETEFVIKTLSAKVASKRNLKGVGGGKDLNSPFFFISTYVIELSFLVSKSAHLSPNFRRFRFYGHLRVGRQNL